MDARRFTDRFLPAAVQSDPDERRRGRLILLSSIVIAPFGVFFSLFLSQERFAVPPATLFTVALGTLIVILNPLLLRALGRTRPSGWIAVGCVHVVMTISPISGTGVDDASLWWLIVVPVLAGFLLGGRAALGFGIVVTVEFWLLFWGDVTQSLGRSPSVDVEMFIALCGSTSTVVLTLLTWGYERARAQANDLLDDKLRELERANLELARLSSRNDSARQVAEKSAEQKERFLGVMEKNASAQGEALEQASTAVAEMNASLRSIAENVMSLKDAAASAEAAMQAVTTGSEQVARGSNEMASGCNNVASALEELAASIKIVSADVGAVSGAAQRTVSEMDAMEAYSVDVQTRSQQASELGTRMLDDARRGAGAVEKTLKGIDDIAQNAQVVRQVIEDLADRIEQIGQVLTVIDEVVSQTNLLALNASILASQAGDHGRGFMVVALEIKKLSERTGVSTSEIGAQIGALTNQSMRAKEAILRGEEAVQSAVDVSEQARAALSTIQSSSEKSSATIRAIAQATGQQGTRAERVSEAMRQVASTLAEVSREIEQQVLGTDRALTGAKHVRGLSDEVAMASDDQVRGGMEMEKALKRIHDMLRALSTAHAEQTRGSDQILNSIEEIHAQQMAQLSSLEEMSTTTKPGV